MITNKTKSQKTTEIYFDETPAPVVIRTHNTALKKRLLAFAKKFPTLCRLTDDDELGCLSFEIDKARVSIRKGLLTASPIPIPRNVRLWQEPR